MNIELIGDIVLCGLILAGAVLLVILNTKEEK